MKRSHSKILALFHSMYGEVAAYKKFFDASGKKPSDIQRFAQFSEIPITTKENYICKYPWDDLYSKKNLLHVAYASSGSSGKSTFWFRSEKQEKMGIAIHETITRDIYGIRKEQRTLIVICFSMGIWVAGGYTFESFKGVAAKGYTMTIVTPGIEKEDIFNVLQNLAPSYDNVILAGYPPFLADTLDEAKRMGIKIKNNIFVLTAGDKFSEAFRAQLLSLYPFHRRGFPIVNLYGCADAGIIGHETPASIAIRTLALAEPELYAFLFGGSPIQAGLYQFDPETIFLESVNGEIILTAETGLPLMRYNIHDIGQVVSHEDLKDFLKSHGLLSTEILRHLERWDLPFVTVNGRTDVAVTYYALNIFPEHLKISLLPQRLRNKLSGNLFAYTTTNAKHVQKLHIRAELMPDIKPSVPLAAAVEECLFENLTKMNMEYRKLYNVLGDKAKPQVSLVPFRHGKIANGNKGLSMQIGKKSKMITYA